MKDNSSKIVRLVTRDGIHVLPKKEYCLSNDFERLGPLKKAEEIAKYRKVGITMIDLGAKVVFFSSNDLRFEVQRDTVL